MGKASMYRRLVSSQWVRFLLVIAVICAGFVAWQETVRHAGPERGRAVPPLIALPDGAVEGDEPHRAEAPANAAIPAILSRLFLLSTLPREAPPRALIDVMDDAGHRASVLPIIGDVVTDGVVLSCVREQTACVAIDGREWVLHLTLSLDDDDPGGGPGETGSGFASGPGNPARPPDAITRLPTSTYEHLQVAVADSLEDPANPAADFFVAEDHILVTGKLYDHSLLHPGDRIVSVNFAAINELAGKGPMGSTLALPTLRLEVRRGETTLVFQVERDDQMPGGPAY